jgi:hypothetical protein
MKTLRKVGITTGIIILLTMLSGFGTSSLQAQVVRYTNPVWAPAYYPGVRYYYIPDIEAYYDLSNQDFVYLDEGQWLFSYGLPPMYAGFDLFDAFVIALDVDVFQPWMHHQFYVSNYPRYYYRSVYKETEVTNIRGFNENGEKSISFSKEDRNKMNELKKNATAEKKTGTSRPAQKSKYYGSNIGQHVKVQPQMRENTQGEHERR